MSGDAEGVGITLTLDILGEGHGALHTVPVGLSNENMAIIIRSEVGEDGDPHISIFTGSPFENDNEGTVELGEILVSLGQSLLSEEFQAAWRTHRTEILEGDDDVEKD